IAFRQQSAAYGTVGEELEVMRLAELAHLYLGPAIDQRILHLVRHDADTMLNDDVQMLCIEVGESQMTDFALVAQLSQVTQRLQIVGIAVIPPVELQQVKTVDIH